MEFHSLAGPLPSIPDDLTIPQFIFDYYTHPNRPTRDPNVPWLIDSDTGRKYSGEETRQRTYALANALKARFDIAGEDSVVLVFSRNHIDYPITMWATFVLGGIISGANPDFAVNELLYQINETKPAVLFVYPERLDTATEAARLAGIPSDRIIVFDVPSMSVHTKYPSVEQLVQEGLQSNQTFVERKLKPGEGKTKLAFLSFSSGTTGKPKAVAIPHYSVITNVVQIAAHNKVNVDDSPWKDRRFRPGDVTIGVLPIYHIYGLVINLHFCLFSAMSIVMVQKFNFVGMLESIMRYHISHLWLVPPQVILLCKHPATSQYDVRRHIRFIMSGAAPLSHEVNEQLYTMFPNAHIGQAYGMTETCTATTMFSIKSKRGISGGSGILLPGMSAKVIKPDGTFAGYDEPGELLVRTPSIALGYVNNEQATKETFLNGWVKTGDEVKIARNGEEIMKVKGFQVAPAELEGCLLDHEDVDNACVVGVPDDYSGEAPMAFVVLRPAAAERISKNSNMAQEIKNSIIKHVADNKVAYKHLAGGVEIVSSIPTSPSGKLLRRVLRDQAKAMRAKVKSKL
ncbi:hypothetical protein AMATHDRAFT_138090 [Amanita thiersii Skay4041]|uniref:AMP-dependent synthetase/ligase domain-containing protein n=1 Tax=Amanita thiersii Skay4041 TaxID=703135 RepID=A0A2A9NQV4_9AGAR|nr:hypothetical protein AMATHDRAFT_138090 [Amanita thiersii Skay4041]